MSADTASIEAILAAGREVRLLPLRQLHRDEDPLEMVLQVVLQSMTCCSRAIAATSILVSMAKCRIPVIASF